MMAHKVRILKGEKTIRLHYSNCKAYNADFDGDEMNLHLPQTEEARAEAYVLLGNRSNLVTPKNGEILIAAIQDFITGAYLLTQKDEFLTKEQVMQLVACFISDNDSNLHIDLPTPAIIKPRRLWTGKQIFSILLRPNKKVTALVNLSVKGRNYTKGQEMCVNDSCKFNT